MVLFVNSTNMSIFVSLSIVPSDPSRERAARSRTLTSRMQLWGVGPSLQLCDWGRLGVAPESPTPGVSLLVSRFPRVCLQRRLRGQPLCTGWGPSLLARRSSWPLWPSRARFRQPALPRHAQSSVGGLSRGVNSSAWSITRCRQSTPWLMQYPSGVQLPP